MKIKELQSGQGKVNIEADIIEMGNIREFEKFGRQRRVCNFVIKDDSGKINLTLWNEQIDEFMVNDRIKISNGYVKEWLGELQLSVGKYGQIKKIQ